MKLKMGDEKKGAFAGFLTSFTLFAAVSFIMFRRKPRQQ
jgi:hypothetical protein